jgi:hypothetical protein
LKVPKSSRFIGGRANCPTSSVLDSRTTRTRPCCDPSG